jgi:hypothetical protein
MTSFVIQVNTAEHKRNFSTIDMRTGFDTLSVNSA